MVFDLFKSKEEKEREERKKGEVRENEERQRHEERKRAEILDQVIFTPESLENYEKRVGYAVEVIETGERDKGVVFEKDGSKYIFKGDADLKRRLAEAGIEAVVENSISFKTCVSGGGEYRVQTEISQLYYGIPVTRKKGGPYR